MSIEQAQREQQLLQQLLGQLLGLGQQPWKAAWAAFPANLGLPERVSGYWQE